MGRNGKERKEFEGKLREAKEGKWEGRESFENNAELKR